MKSEIITSRWYDLLGERCLRYYKKSQDREVAQLRDLLKKISPKATILDAGCGIAKPVSKFLTQKKYNVIGIDISEEMVKKARKNVPKAQFKVMSMYDLKFPLKKFDAIISFFVILHLEKSKISKVFKDFYRILKERGYLLFSINRGKTEGYLEFYGKEIFLSTYTKEEIEEILGKTGFRIIWKKDLFFRKEGQREHQLYYFVQKK